MYSIEIDFDVFKALTAQRKNEEDTYNEVLRRLLKLTPKFVEEAKKEEGKAWVVKGVSFPHGTKFQANYKGQLFKGEVRDGALIVNDEKYTSPSSAAVAITGNPVNGWRFWKCKMSDKDEWGLMEKFRKK